MILLNLYSFVPFRLVERKTSLYMHGVNLIP